MRETCFGSHSAAVGAVGLLVSETEYPGSLRTPSHRHPFACVHFVLHGVYREGVPGASHALDAGRVLFKPGGVRHWNEFGSTGARALRIQFDPEAVDPRVLDALPGRATDIDAAHLAVLARRIHRELSVADDLSEVITASLVTEFLVSLARILPTAESRSDGLARRCADLLRDRFAEPYRLGMAAEELGVERTALARAFRAEYGCSVGEYLRKLRLDYVVERMRRDPSATLSEIAAGAGFADQSHLTRSFKAEFGRPPGVWSNRHG